MALKSPLGNNRLTVFAVGYVSGTLSSYTGLTVKGSGSSARRQVNQVFNTGNIFTDLSAMWAACRNAGDRNLQSGSGLFFDSSVDTALNDAVNASSSVGLAALLSFFQGSGSAAPSGTPTIGKGAFYIRTGGSGSGTTLYLYNGAGWNPVTGA